ncbi:cupin domain-containing protein [Mesorhizobium sp. LHD-90]|uniref:cupin domain-containing protein n=1 Tax=Mesorhizobium sp. LHD-90 TaxID=3071414 RepID=UPI0027E16397|nr:cupin domain-containing protein [Mesorhizobium sp. LHD-90]MDQ6436747.1 cupin domain-containing protein [Mesorhizobium sp. LHD-90]
MSAVTKAEDWLTDLAGFQGEWQGTAHGAGICVIANRIDGPGSGPRLHKHPYPEVFVIRRGSALFTIGSEKIEAGEGSILVAPAGTPHKFENSGPGPLETIDIHQNGSFVTEWLE